MHLRSTGSLLIFIGAALAMLAVLAPPAAHAEPVAFEHFVTASEGRLMDGDRELRFLSMNIPNLLYVEDELDFTSPHPYRLPDAFEVRDALLSIKQMGGTVVRTYVIPVRRHIDPPEVPTYVLGPGKFDETAFRALDLVLAQANEIGVRVIIPFVNDSKWMGGRLDYAAIRCKAEYEFWTDPQLIDDMKRTIAYVANRKNTITGVAYRDDKAILCWETGNELMGPHSWTHEIAAYIKSQDANHLVMDGYNAQNERLVREESLADPSIDIVSSHHYETNPDKLLENIRGNLAVVAGRKPYVIGEFGFVSTPAVERILDLVAESRVSGALVWSLRFHRREGGFYWHSEPFGYGVYKAYHWPGFATGDAYDEHGLLALMRSRAFALRGEAAPVLEAPAPPTLLPIDDVAHISWQGSAGAAFYAVERSSDPDGPWSVVAGDVDDASLPYAPLFSDASAKVGHSHFYRVRAGNSAGLSGPSNVVGPVKVAARTLVDPMLNLSAAYFSNGRLAAVKGDDRRFREVLSRVQGAADSEIVYYVPGAVERVQVDAFAAEKGDPLVFLTSADGEDYQPLASTREGRFGGTEDYGYWAPVRYTASPTRDARYVKLVFRSEAQIARVEVRYR